MNSTTSSSCKVTTAGSIVTTTMGSTVTSWSNSVGSTTITAIIPNGFYSGKTAAFTDSLLVAANIKYGVSIFGVTGTDPGLASNAARDKATTQLSAAGEATTYAGLHLPTGYREVPTITKDDDGTTGGNVTYVDRSAPVSWTGRTCGTSGTITQRIDDCAVQLGTEAIWSGSTKGNAGQFSWQIVTRTGDCGSTAPNRTCREVWRDNRTQLLWSSRISESINWCRSSGNNNIAGNPSAEDDASDYCDNVGNQAVAGMAVSACYEDGSTNFTNAHATITNANGKGGLSLSSTPAIAWRLPTMADYRQADIDGIRYVLPDMGTNADSATSYEWSATVLSSNRASAWIFDTYLGYAAINARNSVTYNATTIGVRCVGR